MTAVLTFRVVDASVPPASDLIEAMVEDLIPVYGRIDVPGAPAGGPEQFTAERGGAYVVGFGPTGAPVCGGGVKRLGDDVCEIKRMYTVPEARGQGAAKELLRALEDAARELGFARARLDTGPKQPHAERLYLAAGYVPIADYNGNPFASFWGEKAL